MADPQALRLAARALHEHADEVIQDCIWPDECAVCVAIAEELRTVACNMATDALEMEMSR